MKIDKIKSKLQTGDYATAASMLNISVEAFRKRFDREKDDAITALSEVIENREQLIESYQNKAKG